MLKRLFIFAGYDANGIIDDALLYYLAQLNKFGDIVLCMDCDAKKTEINKTKKYCLYAVATRHGEYDFGSYKRAYIWARDNNILNKYDLVYIVNDSVFGPMFNMSNLIKKLDSMPTDASGVAVSKHKTHAFMESWFVRLNKNIFTSNWFDEFISSITTQPTKNRVSVKYEHGLSRLISEHKCFWGGIYVHHGRFTYNNPKRLFKNGCPFIKKACFTRHYGALGNEIKYILAHSNKNAATAIMNTANRVYGADYMNWFLTINPFKIIWRRLKYATRKTMDKIK